MVRRFARSCLGCRELTACVPTDADAEWVWSSNLRLVAEGRRTAAARKLRSGWYWFLPNIRRLGRRRFNEVVVQTNPFPTEEMLDAWRQRGVDLLRIHNDSDAIHGVG